MKTPKVKCTCKQDFQDKLYGVGIRVTTPVTKSMIGGKLVEVRCTGCGKVHRV